MMQHLRIPALSALVLAAVAGCHSDRPHDVGQERPDVSDLDSRDHGLQSKDVVDASDSVAQYLLSLPEFNGPTRKTVVMGSFENHTQNANFNYDIFIARLRTNIGMHGRDRLMLIENKDRINNLRSKELEGGGTQANLGQGDGHGQGSGSIQPQYTLYGIVSDLPNRGTDYYLFEFTMADMATREQIPLKPFEVKVAR